VGAVGGRSARHLCPHISSRLDLPCLSSRPTGICTVPLKPPPCMHGLEHWSSQNGATASERAGTIDVKSSRELLVFPLYLWLLRCLSFVWNRFSFPLFPCLLVHILRTPLSRAANHGGPQVTLGQGQADKTVEREAHRKENLDIHG
jgi:hypothetical protein